MQNSLHFGEILLLKFLSDFNNIDWNINLLRDAILLNFYE